MTLHQCWWTTRKKFFNRKVRYWVKVSEWQGGFTIKLQILGGRHTKGFFTYVQLKFMSHCRIYGFLLMDCQFGISKFEILIWEQQWNLAFHWYLKGGFSSFYSPLTTALGRCTETSVLLFLFFDKITCQSYNSSLLSVSIAFRHVTPLSFRYDTMHSNK